MLATGRRDAAQLPSDFPDIPYVAADLTLEEGRAAVLSRLPAQVDFAVLNAGIGFYRKLEEEDPVSIAAMFETNLLAAMALAHALHPHLRAAHGVLGLIGSVAHKGAAGMPVYAATKAGLDGFGRSLRSEWREDVDVRVIHPGPTATGMAERAGLKPGVASRLMLPVEAVADGILRAMRAKSFARQYISYRAILGRGHVSGKPRASVQ